MFEFPLVLYNKAHVSNPWPTSQKQLLALHIRPMV